MDIPVRDLKMMYQQSVILWKGQPSYVAEITEEGSFKLFDLKNQKYKLVKWIPENFAPPSVRIGYINLGTNCIYVHRIPARRYKIGLCTDNIIQLAVEHRLEAVEKKEAQNIMRNLQSVCLYNALVGDYPMLEEAITLAKENKGAVAFDKQFAVDYNEVVFYKGKTVGTVSGNRILFNSGFEHLSKALFSR